MCRFYFVTIVLACSHSDCQGRRRHFRTTLCAFFGLIALASSTGLSQEQLPSSAALAKCWQDLGSWDAERAYRAIGQLVQNPETAVELLSSHLEAAKAPDQAQIEAYLKDLSSETFTVRERASEELRKLGELAERPLRKALEAKLDLETRRRVELLLSDLEGSVTSPEKLRQIRAVEVLEMLATPQAKAVLQRLAQGYAEHNQTREAQAALLRLKQRHPVPERWLHRAKDSPPVAGDDAGLPPGAITRLGTTRFRQQELVIRHRGYGVHSAFSPDGHWVISHDDYAIYVWERQTGKRRRKFDLAAANLAVAPKGTLLALGLISKDGRSGAVVCWDWQAGKELQRVDLPSGITPHQVAFAPDAARMLCQRSDQHLCAWDIKTGQEATLWQPAEGLQAIYGFSPDGALAVVGTRTKNYLLDLKTKQKLDLPAMGRAPRLVAFSPDGRRVAISPEYGGGLSILDAATGKPLWRSGEGVGPSVYSLCFSADGTVLAISGYRQEISLWNVPTGKFLRSLPDSRDRNIGAISADGRWLVSSGQAIGVWNLETGQQVETGVGHRVSMEGLQLSRRYDWIVTHDRSKVHLWDPLTGQHKLRLDTGGTFVRGVAVSPDGQWIIAANPGPGEGFVKIWETATGRLRYKLPGHAMREFGQHTDVHFSPDGRFLYSWGDDNYLRKWDVKTMKAVLEFSTQQPGKKQQDARLEFGMNHHGWTSERDRFLKLEDNGDLRTFDTSTGKEAPLVKLGALSFVSRCAFSPTGKLVACFSHDQNLAVRNTTSGKLVFTLARPGWLLDLSFSPDGRTLAAASEDKIILVEMASGQVRRTIPAKAKALTFSADGRFLAAAMADTTALLWDLARLAETPDGASAKERRGTNP